ncbi:nitroreductase family protein [bacterium]|nr:nitroreductase family protein [bacterium]
MVAERFGVLQVIRDRRSIRQFEPIPVEREKILTCIEAARLAPSADHVQPWRFIVLDDPDVKNAFGVEVFSGVYRFTRWAMNAPVLVVLLADLNFIVHRVANKVQKIPYYFLDIGIAGEHFVLQAQSLGLGTCWIGWFNIKRAETFLHVPKGMRICGLIAVGYPSTSLIPKEKKRKSLSEIVHYNRWGNRISE